MRCRWCLVLLTAASHRPPKFGVYGGIKCHRMLSLVNWLLIWSWLLCKNVPNSFSWLFAPMKVVPLSEKMSDGIPRLEVNLLKQDKKHSVVKFDTNSKWIDFVQKQTKTQT